MLKKDKPLYGMNRDRPDSISQNKALGEFTLMNCNLHKQELSTF